MKLFSASASTLALLALATLSPLAHAAEPATEKVENGDEIKCKNIREVGSRIPVRTCHTRAEWAEIARAAQEAMAMRNHTSGCNDSAGAQC